MKSLSTHLTSCISDEKYKSSMCLSFSVPENSAPLLSTKSHISQSSLLPPTPQPPLAVLHIKTYLQSATMHLSSAHAAAVAGAVIMFFFRTAAADFWVVTNEVNSGVDQEWPAPTVEDYFMLFENDPSCDDVMNSRIWDPMEDLSHDDDRGIRCDGCGTGISAGNAQVMEIRADNIHWSKSNTTTHPTLPLSTRLEARVHQTKN